jgi:N-acetylglucosaminyldiphosphoundecaprenol N-acetyl-beta-D-mannosaminyltransferase
MGTQNVFGVSLSQHTMEELVEEISSRPLSPGNGPRMIVTMNLDHVVKLRKNRRFRRAYRKADVVTADGAPIFAYARLRGARISKITGSDLFARLVPRLNPERQRCFFVLSKEEVGRDMVAHLMKKGFARGQLDYCVPPFGFEEDRDASDRLAERIAQFAPTHLFFCVGAPKSEIWCHRYAGQIGDAYVMCIGAGVEFYLGVKKRAPRLMQNTGMEWLWRWGQEPRRLTQRYFVASWGFAGAIRDDLLRQRRHAK